MILSALIALFRLERQGLLYVADGLSGSTLSADAGWAAVALAAPGGALVPGPSTAGGVRLPSGATGHSVWGLPGAGQASRVELVLRLPDVPTGLVELVGWGDDDATFALEYAPTSGMLRALVGSGVALQAPVTLHDGLYHQVGLDMGSDGMVALLVDGVITAATSPVPVPPINASATLRILVGVSPTAELAACAVAPARFDLGGVADRASVLAGSFVLSGHAALDGGPAATSIVVRRVIDRHTVAVVVPTEDRTFSLNVPSGLYEVLCVGPDGFMAQVVDQVAAEPTA